MLVDTHAHIYLEEFDGDLEEIIANCKNEGVGAVFLPNIEVDSISRVNNLANLHPDICYPMMGLHPCYVKSDYKKQLSIIESQFALSKYYGVGEVGIDLHWDKTTKDIQVDAFKIQIDWALQLDLPIIIHSRSALDLTIDIISKKQNGNLRGIFHCFGGTAEQAQKIIELGFFMGIGGVLTFKNSGLDKIVEKISLSHLVLETDAPYLAPTPFRAKRNQSSYVKLIAQKLAKIKGVSLSDIAKVTTENAHQIFDY